ERNKFEADNIHHAEYAALRKAQGTPKNRVGIFYGNAPLDSGSHCAEREKYSNSVGDKERGILAIQDIFTKPAVADVSQRFHDSGGSVPAAHNFQQAHMAHRVEKVRDSKIFFKLLGAPLDQLGKTDGRRVGRNDRSRFLGGVDA